jgi:hypothetical protein
MDDSINNIINLVADKLINAQPLVRRPMQAS